MPLCWACTDAFPSVSSRICVHCNTMRICVYVRRARTASLFFGFGFTNYLPSSLLAPGPLYA